VALPIIFFGGQLSPAVGLRQSGVDGKNDSEGLSTPIWLPALVGSCLQNQTIFAKVLSKNDYMGATFWRSHPMHLAWAQAQRDNETMQNCIMLISQAAARRPGWGRPVVEDSRRRRVKI